MPIKQRGGVWHIDITVGGRRFRQTSGPNATRKDAEELEAALRKRLHDDRHARRLDRGLNRTFGEALLAYLEMAETKQLHSYANLLHKARTLRPHLERVRLEETPEAAEEMKQAMLADGLKPATINRRLAIVRRVLRLSYHRWKWIKAPLSVSLLTEDNERHVYPSTKVVAALAGACPDPDAADFIRLAYFTGLRKSELLRVNEDPEAHINGGFIELYTRTKNKRPGRVPISKYAAPIVARLPLNVTDNSVRIAFEAARTAIKRPDLHFHDLRHGFASLLAESGADFLDIMNLMRHASPASTKRYTHLMDDRLKAAVVRLDRAVKSQNGHSRKETKRKKRA